MLMFMLSLFVAAAQPASLPTSTPPEDSPSIMSVSTSVLDGHWVGGIIVPAGLTIPFELHIDGTVGHFAAPDQGASDIPIRVALSENNVVVEVPSANARFEGILSNNKSVLEGQWTQGERAFPATFRRASSTTNSPGTMNRPQTPVPPFPYSNEELSIPGGATDVRLGATLTVPVSRNERHPAILLLGGNGPQDRDETHAGHKPMAVIADHLSREGFAVLRFDKRGVGDSSGDYSALTGPDLVADAIAALSYLRRHEKVASDRICILGLSEGATIAAELTRSGQVTCVILLSPPGLLPIDLFVQQKRDVAAAAGMTTDEIDLLALVVQQQLEAVVRGASRSEIAAIALDAGLTDAEANRLAEEWLSPEVRTLLGNHPTEALTGYVEPVLIITGGLDRQVDPDLNLPPIRRALEGNSEAQFLQFDNLNHILQPALTGSPSEYAEVDITIDHQVLNAMVDFLESTLGPADAE
ncbi:alpha/beta hydrolase family protein [Qipengyuania qiaonensis]|uniref:Alpha/beta fold hydrolase n=1 Tax=Qipengyuania qiaonensis TaxID=2867240 RepID=A0ABS7J9N4_9SPHN|nr:alpha/beta fold hydrolase [Qipengyuania qiaonensis]MBX7484029.1 alpha/beta fold hydrolase [Qipengyuania qiaonensis]